MANLFLRIFSLFSLSFAFSVYALDQTAYVEEINAWRVKRETSLRADNGWLTLCGRYELKSGVNRIGSGPDNDVVLPKDVAPAYLGQVTIDGDRARFTAAAGNTMYEDKTASKPFTERELGTQISKRDWVYRDRLAFHVFKNPKGKMILRAADNESDLRKNFPGRIWYQAKTDYVLPAKFVAYQPARKVDIVNVLGEISSESMVGYVQFRHQGKTYRLDAFGEEDGSLFIVFNDRTRQDTTYPPGRFLVAPKPQNGKLTIDFNKAYNPPCAFSAYTTCPLPPKQNELKARIEAGEKYRKS